MIFDKFSEERLADIHPLLADRIRRLAEAMKAEGIELRVSQSLRSYNTQNQLFAQGRSIPGSIVTKAPGGYSWHNFALAADVVVIIDGGPDWNIAHPSWKRVADRCPSLGLRSGATFTHMVDYPHLQPEELPESPTAEDRQTFADGGIGAVWDHYFPPMAISA